MNKSWHQHQLHETNAKDSRKQQQQIYENSKKFCATKLNRTTFVQPFNLVDAIVWNAFIFSRLLPVKISRNSK